ncbi:hypothetical protein D3C80_1422330 [compost metagenome]
MSRKSKQINVHLSHIDIQRTGALGCIDQKNSSIRFGDIAYVTNREYAAKQIRAMVADHHFSVRFKEPVQFLQIDLPLFIHPQIIDLYPYCPAQIL